MAFYVHLELVKVFVYTLLFSILFSVYAKLHVCINYALNQSYYAEVLCENKAVKNSCCKGKCAVGKELSDIGKKEEGQAGRSGHPVLKISKAEEALPSRFTFKVSQPLVAVIHTGLICELTGQNPPVLLRPPAAEPVAAAI